MIGISFEALSIYFSFVAFNLDLDIIRTTIITFTSIVVGTISFMPAGIGLTEASLIGLLVFLKVELVTATSLTIFIRLTTIWYATAVGFIVSRTMILRKK